MRIDIVTIFPEFFDVLDVSLVGKARESGLVSIEATNLRDFTHDVHKTVDDSPLRWWGWDGHAPRALG